MKAPFPLPWNPVKAVCLSMSQPGPHCQHTFITVFRQACCGLLATVGLAVHVSRADAAGPGLLDYFCACGIGENDFAKFADDRQVAAKKSTWSAASPSACPIAPSIACVA